MMNTTPLLEGTGLSVVEYKGLATWEAVPLVVAPMVVAPMATALEEVEEVAEVAVAASWAWAQGAKPGT